MRSRPSSKSVNDNDDSVGKFYSSIFPGEFFYDIFENEEEIVTEDSIVWINTNKLIWGVSFIKTPFSDLLEDSNY